MIPVLSLIYNLRNYIIIVGLISILVFLIYKKCASNLWSEPRYIICYPQGKFIDMIYTIINAYNYAVLYDRVLIIDSRKSWFKESIYDYFFIHCPHVYVGDIDFLFKQLNNLTMYPKTIDLLTEELNEQRKFNINLDRDYDEKVVIYSHFGTNRDKISVKRFFDVVSLKHKVYKEYKSARDRLPASYVGVHINSNDGAFLEKHNELLKGKSIVIASRKREVVELFKKEFGAISFSDIPNNNIEEPTGVDIHKYNTDMIVDLLLLASSSELYCDDSAFSKAAVELHEDPKLIARLVKEPVIKD